MAGTEPDDEVICPRPDCSATFSSVYGRNSHLSRSHRIEDELIEELQRLREEIGEVPTQTEIQEHSKFSLQPYYTNFDGLIDAFEQAGLNCTENKISEDELIAELKRLDREFSHPVRKSLIQEEGKYSYHTYTRRFGSMNGARRRAGLDEYHKTDSRISDNELLDEIYTWVNKKGRPPRADEMSKDGKYGRKTYTRRFGSWNNAIRKAGYEPIPPGDEATGEEHPRWKESSEFPDYYGPNWCDARREVIERDGRKCRVCGTDSKGGERSLDVHHITPARKFNDSGEVDFEEMNDLSNLVTLCRRCHGTLEGKLQDCDPALFAALGREHVELTHGGKTTIVQQYRQDTGGPDT